MVMIKTASRFLIASTLFLNSMSAHPSQIQPQTQPSSDSRPRGPIMMGVMGDSISAATLADFPIPHDDSPAEGSGETVSSPIIKDIQEKAFLENKLLLSWASGIAIRSHYMRLRDYFHRKGENRTFNVDNVSYPGRTTSAMEQQALQLMQDFRKGGYSEIKYVTILIGSNDACSPESEWGVPPNQMHDNLMKAFRVLSLIPQKEPIRVLVVGIPRIPELAEPAIRDSKTILGLSCGYVRNRVLRECRALLNWKTEAEYDQKMMVIENDNRMLRDTVTEANQTFPSIDAVYSDRLYNLKIPRDIMAVDCFHPSAAGQQRLADEVWLDQPWFD
jgi:lysophospholipase L1-like esterase